MNQKKYLLVEPDLKIWRDEHGIPHVEAENEARMYWGQGYCHARDRGLQMLLMRILGQGRAAEILDGSDETLAIDLFFRRMNWSGGAHAQIDALSPAARAMCESYCEGANAYFHKKTPWEFKLLRHKPEPWTTADVILLVRMTGYVSLAQSQAEIERLLVQMVQQGVSRAQLDELFPGQLDGLDEEVLRQVRLTEHLVPEEIKWNPLLPKAIASNNWVIAGDKSKSGKPILANDPHLEVNRLPNVWYELVLQSAGRFAMGATMPGMPGILIGRTGDLAWGATYSFMDAVDSWVEQCKGGKYQADRNLWVSFHKRQETIKRKGKPAVSKTFFESPRGVLDGDPAVDGYYLTTRWSSSQSGARSLNHFAQMFHARSAPEGMDLLGQVEIAMNWVLADRQGNIGYQMSGLMPQRRVGVSGLVPLAGWRRENDWQGFVDYRDLPRCLNPEDGLFVTANQDLNRWGKARPINVPMGSYRHDRIRQLLTSSGPHGVDEMTAVQNDVYSPQAEHFMQLLKPLLPAISSGRLLKNWDCRYTAESKGAYLFERFYRALFRIVFGEHAFGFKVFNYLCDETAIFADFYANFDRVLLAEKSLWFNGKTREELYRAALNAALAGEPKNWGETQSLVMRHFLFGGRIPKAFGFDRGPIVLKGGRATPHQGQIFRNGSRVTSFGPSFRMVIDMNTDDMHTSLAGGPSDRRYSKWYCSELNDWLAGKYKHVKS